MGSSRPRHDDVGYATPAALVLSLAFALVGAAMTARSVHLLRLTDAELARDVQEIALDGAHLAAAAAIIRSGGSEPFEWTDATSVGWVRIVAEPEAGKLSYGGAAALPDEVLAGFGVQPDALRAQLLEVDAEAAADPGGLDAAPVWRECGGRLTSPFGAAQDYELQASRQPGVSPDGPNWHIGEVWRVRATSQAGWRDDRIVRFTGDARKPAATVVRVLGRGGQRGIECEDYLTAAAG